MNTAKPTQPEPAKPDQAPEELRAYLHERTALLQAEIEDTRAALARLDEKEPAPAGGVHRVPYVRG